MLQLISVSSNQMQYDQSKVIEMDAFWLKRAGQYDAEETRLAMETIVGPREGTSAHPVTKWWPSDAPREDPDLIEAAA